MKNQTLFKKLISSILVAIIILGQFSSFTFVSKAETVATAENSSMYLSLSKTNKNSDNKIGYANMKDKIIWNMMYSTNTNEPEVASSNIYCIKAEYGDTWGTSLEARPDTRVEYNWSKTLNKDLESTPSQEVNQMVAGEYFDEILWIIDNMYVPGESDKTAFLEQADIHYDEHEGYVYYSTNGHDYSDLTDVSDAYGENTLTDDDIIAIQQSAIWYFTNYNDQYSNYNLKGIASWLRYTTDGDNYTRFNNEEKARDVHSYVLFNYLIDEATSATANFKNTYELQNSTVKLWLSTGTDKQEQPVIEVHKIPKTDVTVEKVWNDNENKDNVRPESIDVQLYANTSKQGDSIKLNSSNGWKYTWDNLQKYDDKGSEIEYIVKELNQEGAEIEVGEYYNVNYKTEYTVVGNKTIITNNYEEEKTFDLALRKKINSVWDKQGNKKEKLLNVEKQQAEREITVDTRTLTAETTATYKHRKDPIVVETGDLVEYSITIYNEGEQAGFAEKIIDQLPGTWGNGLRLQSNTGKVESTTGNIYDVEYDTTNNQVIFTMADESPRNNLEAYDGNKLESETILIKCKVMGNPDTENSKLLTNIAYIAKDYNAETQTIQDRDSKIEKFPNNIGSNLITEDIGYIGSETNPSDSTSLSSNETYYKGQEDDDDFEKLVILPEIFDLSLRKYITKVNGEEITNRKPDVDITNLKNGETTAEYRHRKDAVTVENGNTVEYKITIYNEGSINGVATVIKDQLPTGLKLNMEFFSKQRGDYYEISSKGNVYKVSYDATTNLVEFKLTSVDNAGLLEAYEARENLDNDTITLQCQVECKANDAQNTYLTNIAYIHEAIQEDGTVITNQKNGPDSDRDSEPYTYLDKKANELITIGNTGYTGNQGNTNKDLSQNIYFKGEQDDDDFEKLVMLPKRFDLKLIKFITAVNEEITDNRVISVDTSKLNATDSETTAKYNLEKNPVEVKPGDLITYTLRVYNEGDYDGIATEISENIPEGLEFIIVENNKLYSGADRIDITEEITPEMYGKIVEINSKWQYDLKSYEVTSITTNVLEEELLNAFGKENVKYTDTENKIDYAEVQVILRVKDGIVANQTIRNEAAITNHKAVVNGDEIYIEDRDSMPSDWEKENSDKAYDEAGKWPIYKEDDEDYDNIITKSFDLSLRKQIKQINDVIYTNRYAKLDENEVYTNTLYDYYDVYNNKPKVKAGDIVVYSIRIYNEGEIDGYADLVVDTLPKGLEFVEYTSGDGSINDKYSWKLVEGTENVYQTDYLSYEKDANKGTQQSTIIEAYDGEGEASYQELSIECKVKNGVSEEDSLLNIAQIAEDSDSRGKNINDIDSIPGKKDDETKWKYEDDLDIEILQLKEFDLSLRKHITKVNGEEITNRKPDIDIANLKNGKTTAEYKHRKDAVTVENGNTVEYNITIYNEGQINGIATVIRDQLPTGLKLNKEFFNKEGEEYFVRSSKGNVYKVSYDTTTNLVEFTLDKTKTGELKYLQAYFGESKLDEEIISLRCIVDYIADQKQNIYFTNIAYINKAEQEDGTVITNQKNGPDSDRDSQPYTYPDKKAEELTTVGNIGYTGNQSNNNNLSQNIYFKGEQDDDDFEKLVMLPKIFDLKLIKFITAVNEETTDNRVISVDTSKLNTQGKTTAEYILEKNPVPVKSGDLVTYTLRVYNEGNYDGKATQISENIPEGLEFIVIADGKIYSWDGINQKEITEEIKKSNMYNKIVEINSNWGYSLESSVITTNALQEDLLKAFGKENVQYTDLENKIDYADIQVIFRVKDGIEANKTIRNEATITSHKAVDNGNEIDIVDRDSMPSNWKKENSDKAYDEAGKWPIYKEDDEDYDNIITKSFDLSLRKQIVQMNNDVFYTNRYANVDEKEVYNNTLYDYYDVYNNKPKVKAGDIVVYSIRIYNEGEIDGYADLVVDTLPKGLEFVEYASGDESINDKYSWTLVEGTENVYQTDYLSYEKDANKGKPQSTMIKAYDGEGEASYQEIYIECRIRKDAIKEDSLLNIAQIAEDSDSRGKNINDIDSVPGKEDDEAKWKDEDDLDIEILELQEFDLALRKFITEIENGEETKKVTTRIPQVTYDKETKQLVYTHPKDALVVHVGDTLIYTLRVYNEGDIDGYASEVKDDIPEYLEYLPRHSTNIENQWVMYDSEGNVTENVAEAKFIKTEHLAKGWGVEEEDSEGSNLIKAFNPEAEIGEHNPDYKELQVAFKVKDPNSTEYEIVNFAQISEDSDAEGEPIDDRDSVPDNGEADPKEDDEDIEKVKVEYFDLSLLKYVTKVLVNENGSERVIETGNVGDENDIIPHVQINKKNIDKTVVKFVYSIRITNEGQIAGEATEITDYVPEGLVFVAEDNEHWTDEGNNIISTKQLEGSTLQPGESVEVEVVLRWINGDNNLGPKTNIAEISEDYNEENIKDKDSTPDNKVDGEDDIDDATVLLSVNQGGGIQTLYINLTITFLAIILIGGILIKKFVL